MHIQTITVGCKSNPTVKLNIYIHSALLKKKKGKEKIETTFFLKSIKFDKSNIYKKMNNM